MDRQLGFQLRDSLAGRDQLSVVAAGDARQLATIDQMLPPPQVDHLIADLQIGGDLRHQTTSSDQIQHLATELRRITAGMTVASTG